VHACRPGHAAVSTQIRTVKDIQRFNWFMQLYPDMGVAAMLKNQWGDPGFAVGSLSDRTPYQEEDDIIIFAAPDPQGG
jgi:hypothetical protein